ncbi:MAG: Co2+/Mg2+ efflux protein ApaG [Saprospiraceae bacterium]
MRQTQITQGIEISIQPDYQEQYSNPTKEKYVYAYHVTIRNKGRSTVQLLRRHWFIYDSDNRLREVEGEGVIGQTPVIRPGERFEYNSWTEMRTTIGKMYGYYTMQRITDGAMIEAAIPEFQLVAPFIQN